MRGRIVVIARQDWAGFARLPARRTLGGRGGRARRVGAAGRRVGRRRLACAGGATCSPLIRGPVDAVRTAERGRYAGLVGDPARSPSSGCWSRARSSARRRSERELGPLLADERLGAELVETLQVYFDAGENMRETARRLHLANRTVAYRLAWIEAPLGGPCTMGAAVGSPSRCSSGGSSREAPEC